MVEALRLLGRLERHSVLGGARCAEIIRDAADGDHQRIVAHTARRSDPPPFLVEGRGEMHALAGPIEPNHLAELVAEVVPMGLSQIVELMLARIHATRRDRVQERLPQMRAAPFDEDDLGKPTLAEPVSETRRELEPGGSAADDHDPVRGREARQVSCLDGHRRHGFGHEATPGRSLMRKGQRLLQKSGQAPSCRGLTGSKPRAAPSAQEGATRETIKRSAFAPARPRARRAASR